MTEIETDYLIVGSGAMGMAFADTLLTESDADMVIVDRHAKPAGIGMSLIRLCACTNHRVFSVSLRAN